MRINLSTPFAARDAVKALGVRWDTAKKVGHINDVADFTPFLRCVPDLATAGRVFRSLTPYHFKPAIYLRLDARNSA